MKQVLILFFVIVAVSPANAGNYLIRNYTKMDGLPGGVVLGVCQDSGGFLWFATERGLCCFDGVSFQTVTDSRLADKFVWTVFEDRNKNIWAGLEGNGPVCLPAPENLEPVLPEALQKASVLGITQDNNGGMWFATMNGVMKLEWSSHSHSSLTIYSEHHGLPPGKVLNIAFDKQQILWASTEKGIYYFENNRFHPFKPFSLPENSRYSTVFPDSRGRVWMGSQGRLAYWENGVLTQCERFREGSQKRIVSIFETLDGNIGVTTWKGVFIREGDRFIPIGVENGLSYNFVYRAIPDREGNLWFATHSGVSCLRNLRVMYYSKLHNLPHNTVYNFAGDNNGRTWVATAEGVCYIEDGEIKNIDADESIKRKNVHALAFDENGVLWVGTTGGLGYVEDNRLVQFNGFKHIIFEFAPSKNGGLWIASYRGLFRLNNGTVAPPPITPLPSMATVVMESAAGDLWFGVDGALYWEKKGKVTAFQAKTGQLAGVRLRELFEDSSGGIWACSNSGVTRIHAGKPGSPEITHFSTADGLPDNQCNFILQDADRNLWFGTEKGLARFDGQSFKSYTARGHGLVSDYWISGAKTPDGKFWLGSDQGVTTFYPPPFRSNTIPPPIHITGVKIMETDLPVYALGELDHDMNTVRFHYTGICYSAPLQVKYKYKLHSTDAGWKETTDPFIYLPYLSPGNYSFMVKAVNNDGIESVSPARLDFRILPPFWQTWWFQLLVFLVAVSLPTWFLVSRQHRARERAQLKARNKQLVMAQRMELMGNLAAGTVHDLKNLLSIILGYTRVMGRQLPLDDPERGHVETIRNTASTAVQMSKQILSLARYPDDLPGSVVLGELLEEILDTLDITLPNRVNMHRDIPDEPIRFAIHPARFQQVVINLCQNAAHAMPEGGDLTVSLNIKPLPAGKQEIELQVRDTGTGIPPDKIEKIFKPLFTTKENGRGTGLGLFVVDQIVQEHGGRIDVNSEPGKGTTFFVRFPITD